MEPRGVLAFAQEGYFLAAKKLNGHRGLPQEVVNKIKQPGAIMIYAIAIGTGGDFFFTHIDKDGKTWRMRSLSNYPGLERWCQNHKTWTAEDHRRMSCALGPGGAYYVSAPGIGQAQSGLDSRLEREILRRLNEEKLFVGDPASVTLGIKGSYVLVGKKGDIFWDLKGEYTQLDNMLQSSEVGVETITLSPFNGNHWYVLFKDGSASWDGSITWNLKLLQQHLVHS